MTERTVYRGDTYVIRRSVFDVAIVDDALAPMNLAGCTVKVTFKPAKTDPATDPEDTGAALTGEITFDGSGAVTGTPEHMQLPAGGSAADGVVQVVADRATTLALPLNMSLGWDVVLVDANGEEFTVEPVVTLKAVDGYTNR